MVYFYVGYDHHGLKNALIQWDDQSNYDHKVGHVKEMLLENDACEKRTSGSSNLRNTLPETNMSRTFLRARPIFSGEKC